ncbi:MAG TPA: PIN domain-containing protein, partial [Solirubrobacterales bacterium]|nr:PIN domain-containing protein [Solirubrobacterales bacterium]
GTRRALERPDLTVLLDTNVLIRHLTGDPPEMARRATRFLATETELVLADVVLAECVYVLQSVYEVERPRIAEMMRAALAMPAVSADTQLFLRALEVYEVERLDFAEAYLVAKAELTDSAAIASFDKAIDRVESVLRLVP